MYFIYERFIINSVNIACLQISYPVYEMLSFLYWHSLNSVPASRGQQRVEAEAEKSHRCFDNKKQKVSQWSRFTMTPGSSFLTTMTFSIMLFNYLFFIYLLFTFVLCVK